MRKALAAVFAVALALMAALPVTDAFTGADGTALATHEASWTVNTGGFEISSNKLISSSVPAIAHWDGGETFADGQYAQAATNCYFYDQQIGPAVRVDAAADTGYFVTCTSNTTIRLYRAIAGTTTSLGTYTGTIVSGDILRLEASGTSLTVKLNGTPVLGPITDANIASGDAGIRAYGSAGFATLDDWEGGDLGAAAPARRRVSFKQ